ncbi:MAG: hypothetical protein OXT74_18145 [Candidatus Poribacteria bacterium]|nr:hypothetical protein [Candidatus Poribacteria bacterium]
MNNDPQTTEIRNLVEQTHEMVIQIAKDQNQMRGEITQISERIGSLEGRMTALETRMDARMTALETRMSNLELRMSDLESRMSKEIRDVFKWLIGMMIPVWVGVIAALIIQFLKTG